MMENKSLLKFFLIQSIAENSIEIRPDKENLLIVTHSCKLKRF